MTSAQDAEAAIARLGEVVPVERTTDWLTIQSRLHTLESGLEESSRRVNTMAASNDIMRAERLGMERALNVFKAQVRTEAIEHAAENDHCRDGLNDLLERLGLEKVVTAYQVIAAVLYAPRIYTVTVEAEDEDAAANHVSQTIANGHASEGEWRDLEVQDVEIREVSADD